MAVTTAGGISYELLPQTMLATLFFLFLIHSSTAIAGSGGMLAFHLTRINGINGTSSINEYAAHMLLGPTQNPQSVYLQPILYGPEFRDRETSVPKPVYVPTVELCLDYQDPDEWSKFIRPDNEEKIIDTTGAYQIEWDPDISIKKVNLALRKEQNGTEGTMTWTIASMNLRFRCIGD